MAAARELIGKHVSVAMDMHATVEILLETGLSVVVCAKGL
jgi:hypothetical protein